MNRLNMNNLRTILCALLVVMSDTCHGGFVASFTADGNAPVPSVISVGDTIDVSLYLRYDGNGDNLLNAPGLLTGGLGITMSQTGIADASLLSLGAGWDPLFSFATIDNGNGVAILQTAADFFSPAVTDGGTNSILLGTFRFTGTSAGSVQLTLGDAFAGIGNDDTVLDDGLGTVLDGDILFGDTFGFTVHGGAVAVPEPSSGLLLFLGSAVMVWRARRRKLSSAE
ncbi:MAG: PEP-CTERM sorting domain-containing protein [Planctomyces sp.]|nr:PEP-CTERM sorting domain-containing protein [Planctomyces sp.]